MSEVTEVTEVTEPTQTDALPQTSAETTNTEGDGKEHFIPKSRFDEVNDLLKESRKETAKYEAAQKKATAETAKADEDRLIANGKIQEAYDSVRAELDAKDKALFDSEQARLKMQVGQKYKLPEALLARLQGETLEEMETDAELLAAFIPATDAPPPPAGTDSSNGVNNTQPTPAITDLEIQQQAVRLNVHPAHLKQHLGIL